MIDLTAYGFTNEGQCKTCGGRAEKYTLGTFTVKYFARKNYFKLYNGKQNIAFGKMDQLLPALIKHHVIELTSAA